MGFHYKVIGFNGFPLQGNRFPLQGNGFPATTYHLLPAKIKRFGIVKSGGDSQDGGWAGEGWDAGGCLPCQ